MVVVLPKPGTIGASMAEFSSSRSIADSLQEAYDVLVDAVLLIVFS
jgi:hypothetical protein